MSRRLSRFGAGNADARGSAAAAAGGDSDFRWRLAPVNGDSELSGDYITSTAFDNPSAARWAPWADGQPDKFPLNSGACAADLCMMMNAETGKWFARCCLSDYSQYYVCQEVAPQQSPPPAP